MFRFTVKSLAAHHTVPLYATHILSLSSTATNNGHRVRSTFVPHFSNFQRIFTCFMCAPPQPLLCITILTSRHKIRGVNSLKRFSHSSFFLFNLCRKCEWDLSNCNYQREKKRISAKCEVLLWIYRSKSISLCFIIRAESFVFILCKWMQNKTRWLIIAVSMLKHNVMHSSSTVHRFCMFCLSTTVVSYSSVLQTLVPLFCFAVHIFFSLQCD